MNTEYFNTTFDLSAHHPAFMDDADGYDPKPANRDEEGTNFITKSFAERIIMYLECYQTHLDLECDGDYADWQEMEEICEKLKEIK